MLEVKQRADHTYMTYIALVIGQVVPSGGGPPRSIPSVATEEDSAFSNSLAGLNFQRGGTLTIPTCSLAGPCRALQGIGGSSLVCC